MDLGYHLGRELYGRDAEFRQQSAGIAILDAGDPAHAVTMPQVHHNGIDNVVRPGHKPPAGDEAALTFGGIKKDLFARAGHLDKVLFCVRPHGGIGLSQ